MKNGKKPWKWIAGIAGLTAVAVAATLGIHLLQQKELCAPGFSYDMSYQIPTEDQNCILSSAGEVFLLEEGGSSLEELSLDRKTGVYLSDNRSLGYNGFVVSPYGGRYLSHSVGIGTLWISSYGDTIYYLTFQSLESMTVILMRYDVATDTETELDLLSDLPERIIFSGAVSPDGDYFSLSDGETLSLYGPDGTRQELLTNAFRQPCFVKNDGTVFAIDEEAILYMVGSDGKNTQISPSEDGVSQIYFNRDGTEMLLLTQAGDTCFYEMDGDAQQTPVLCLEGDQVTPYINQYTKIKEMNLDTVDKCYIMDIASFRDVNLKSEATGMRAKWTKEHTLVYQEYSQLMSGTLSPNGAYILYTDADGDYFYTDTEDIEGEYHFLWEASQCDISFMLCATSQKSFYYFDTDNNLHYANPEKDVILCSQDMAVSVRTFDDATDTCYWYANDVLYCSRKGESFRKIWDGRDMHLEYVNVDLRWNADTGVVYMIQREWSQGEYAVYRISPNGRYEQLECVSFDPS